MSYKVTGWVWEHATQTGSEKLTLLALADMCNHEGECFPGVERVANMVGVTHRRMQQILRKLESDKVLKIEYEAGLKTKTGNTNRYSILPYISSLEVEGVKSTTPPGVKSTTPELSVVTVSKEKDSTPDGVSPPTQTDEKPSTEPIETKDENKAISELIQVWIESQKIIDSKAYGKTGYRSVARDLHRAGITPEDIKQFIAVRNQDVFWKDKTIPWSHIQANISTWKAQRNTPPPKTQTDIAMERLAQGLPYVFG